MMNRLLLSIFLILSLGGSSLAFQREDPRDRKKPPPEKPRESRDNKDNKKPPEKVIEREKDRKRPD